MSAQFETIDESSFTIHQHERENSAHCGVAQKNAFPMNAVSKFQILLTDVRLGRRVMGLGFSVTESKFLNFF